MPKNSGKNLVARHARKPIRSATSRTTPYSRQTSGGSSSRSGRHNVNRSQQRSSLAAVKQEKNWDSDSDTGQPSPNAITPFATQLLAEKQRSIQLAAQNALLQQQLAEAQADAKQARAEAEATTRQNTELQSVVRQQETLLDRAHERSRQALREIQNTLYGIRTVAPTALFSGQSSTENRGTDRRATPELVALTSTGGSSPELLSSSPPNSPSSTTTAEAEWLGTITMNNGP